MILLLVFIMGESTVLFAGCGLAFNLAIDSHNPEPAAGNRPAGWPGYFWGILFAWLVRRFFDKAPAVGWVWVYTILSAWVIGGGVYYLTVADANRPWVLIAMSCCLGTLPGLGMGWLLARIRPALWLKVPNAPLQEAFPAGRALFMGSGRNPTPALAGSTAYQSLPDYEDDYEMPLLPPVAAGSGMRAGSSLFTDPSALQKRLKDETVQLELNHPGSSSDVVPLAADRAAVMFNLVNYLGLLKFYIVCGADYPAEPPEDVFLEFVPVGQDETAPLKIDYQGAALDDWQPGYDLETVVKDAALQVEESMIS